MDEELGAGKIGIQVAGGRIDIEMEDSGKSADVVRRRENIGGIVRG